jgi:hypothetical protein
VLLPGFTGQKPPCILVGESVLNFSWEIAYDSLEINYFVSQEAMQRWPSATEVRGENKAIFFAPPVQRPQTCSAGLEAASGPAPHGTSLLLAIVFTLSKPSIVPRADSMSRTLYKQKI